MTLAFTQQMHALVKERGVGPIARARRAVAALETLRALEDRPTPEQVESLRGWCGWGPLAPAFGIDLEGAWGEIADRLDELFAGNPDDLVKGSECVDNSFYTPEPIIAAMFNLLRRAGFAGGSVLEPGCGSGRFMQATPADMPISWTGVESDPTSARIAAVLNPDARIIAKPLQKTVLRSGSFDAVIGNVPFSSSTVFDPEFTASSLHEYFLLRAVDAVRPGGYIVAVTSRHTMDSHRGLAGVLDRADMVGAVRLPSGAFSADGTDAVTDVLVLQRRTHGSTVQGWNDTAENAPNYVTSWSGRRAESRRLVISGEGTNAGRTAEVNRYWGEYPAHIAGVMKAAGPFNGSLIVESADPAGDISRAFASVAEQLLPYIPGKSVDAVAEFADVVLEDAQGRKEGSFHLAGAGVVRITSANSAAAAVKAGAELRALIVLRDAVLELLALESNLDLADEAITPARESAARLYSDYQAKFGPLNRGTLVEGKIDTETDQPTYSWRRPTMGGFRKDPDYTTILTIELYDPEHGTAAAAPILTRRVNRRPIPVESAATAGEALALAMGEGRGVDLERIRSLLGLPSTDATVDALDNLIYADPEFGGAWTLDRDYLSGDVRSKLATARKAAEGDPAYRRNVDALEVVMPKQLGPEDIRTTLGSPWVSAKDVEAFLEETMLRRTRVLHTPAVALWEVEDPNWGRLDSEVAIAYGTTRISPFKLAEHGLNNKSPIIFDEVYDPTSRTYKKVRNNNDTVAAVEKLAAIAERFSVWVWENAERTERLCAEYNRRFSSHVTRRNDGSHLTFPGMSDAVQLWPWQRDIIDRIISSPRTLCGHAVGAGKTKSMIGAAMTLRRLGLANKPLIAVPNHLLEQIAAEARQTFPAGKFLIASADDLAGDGRRLFAARCATGDWDAVVMTHRSFTSLPVDPDVEAEWMEGEKADLREALQRVEGGGRSRGAKAIAGRLRKLEARLEALRHNTGDDGTVRFDQLGVDFIAVDEAHLFKRLTIDSKETEGFATGGSKRATDLLLKIRTLSDKNPDRPHVALFTGTPWTNSLAETFVWQTYLQPERLRHAGVEKFDAWVSSFVRYETAVETTPDGGGFRLKRRPAAITNLPEMRSMLAEVADLLPASAINLQRPDVTYKNVKVSPAPLQKQYVAGLTARADAIANRMPLTPNDFMLLVCTDGRKVALDPRLVGLNEASPKMEAVAQNVAELFRGTADLTYDGRDTAGALQLVMLDLGTPKPEGTQTYGRLKDRLVQLGVPASRVRWIHEAKTDKAKEALYAACRDGSVSVIIGSTEKIGLGTNIQDRLIAVHHADAPWRPSDLEQREGRAVRPGNLNSHVWVFRYVTEGTFDAYTWQTLERKSAFIAMLFRADTTVREIEDIGDVTLSYGEVKALASGNPALLEQAKLQADVRRLRIMQSAHLRSVNAAADNARRLDRMAGDWRRSADLIDKALAALKPTPDDMFSVAAFLNGSATYGDRWRGLKLSPTGNTYGKERRRKPAIEFDIEVAYQVADTLTVQRSQIRRGNQQAAANLRQVLETWIEQAPAKAVRLRNEAETMEAEATRSLRVAERSVFDKAADLADAERRLAVVQEQIAFVAEQAAAA